MPAAVAALARRLDRARVDDSRSFVGAPVMLLEDHGLELRRGHALEPGREALRHRVLHRHRGVRALHLARAGTLGREVNAGTMAKVRVVAAGSPVLHA